MSSSFDDLFDGDDLVAPAAKTAPKQSEPAVAVATAPAPAAAPVTRATSPTGSAAVAAQAATKMQQIEKELNDNFMERENEIHSLMIGLIAGRHVLLLGPPGTGKSALAYALANAITGGTHFQILLNQTTDPSELLGPYSLSDLKNDKFRRNPKGRLPEADTSFLDEVFKSNSAALNILLPMLNERIWYNDGVPQPAKLQFAVAASNEEPQDDSLAAFHDRFPFRHWVEYVRDSGNKAKMFKQNIEQRNPNINSNRSKTTITLQELEALRAKAQTVTVDQAVVTAFQGLIFELEKVGMVISDRRQAVCFELAQANAAFDGRSKLLTDDFICLIPVLWQRKDDITKVEQEVLKLANPFEEKTRKMMTQAREMFDKVMNTVSVQDRTNAAIDVRDQFNKMDRAIDKLLREATNDGRDTTKISNTKEAIKNMNKEVVEKCLLMGSSSGADDAEDMPF